MDDPTLMCGGEGVCNLFHHFNSFVYRQRAVLEPVAERFAFDQLHHDAAAAAELLETVYLSDVGMIQRRQKLGFALKPREPVAIVRKMIGQDFHCHITQQLRVAGAENNTHAAFSKLRRHFICTDTSTCCYCHSCRRLYRAYLTSKRFNS